MNTFSLNKNFDGHQHLLSCTKNNFYIIGVTEIRITKLVSLLNNLNLNNYSYEFIPTKTTTRDTLFLLLIIYHRNVLMT